MLNKCILMGRLTADPELRKTGSGLSVCSFTLAVDQDYAKDGEEKGCDFINIVAWRNTADFVSKYFFKGKLAVVSGRLSIRRYEDKNGNNRTAAEVVADNVYFGDSKRQDSKPASAEPEDAAPVAFADLEDDDSGLPF